MKTILSSLAAVVLAALASTTAAAAAPVEGVLEKGAIWSAIFSASPESGDLIGYGFKTQSPAGKAILASCLPGLVCKIEKSTLRDLPDASALKFEGSPSGWFEITAARSIGMLPTAIEREKKSKTRYGFLSVNEDDNTLLFKGKRVLPGVEGNNSLTLLGTYELGRNDVVLLENSGGSACPALFRFITVNASGLAATPEFGSCSDIIFPTSDGKAQVTVAMPGFAGASEPRAAQSRAAMTKTVYRYQNGLVTENGKPVK